MNFYGNVHVTFHFILRTFSRRHTNTHADSNRCHSERYCRRSTTTLLCNVDMSSSNHTKAFVQCCHGKHTVASSLTLLSITKDVFSSFSGLIQFFCQHSRIISDWVWYKPISGAARFEDWVCGGWVARIAGSKTAVFMNVSLLYMLCAVR
jgi:hypothetical protein